MITKIVSFVMSLVMSFVGLNSVAAIEGLKVAFNNAHSLLAERSDFIEDIDESDVSLFSESSGYIKNIALVFFEEDASFFEKISALRSIDGAVIGSLPDANLCVVATAEKNYAELNELCKAAQEHEAVALASICPVRKTQEQYTPNDPVAPEWDTEDWSEENPEGYNWWLEAIDARAAWGYSSCFNHINVGVIDSGIDTNHVELEGKVIFPSELEASRNKARHHGTHVAGIIAAKGDNETGICGLCQNSTLISVNWNAGLIEAVSIFFGVGKVVKAGAKVVNMSLGSSGALDEDEWYWMNFMNDIEGMIYSYYMGSLLNRGYDFVVVQSSGNGNGPGHPIDSGQNGSFCCVNERTALTPIGIGKQDVLDRIIVVGACYYEDGKYIQSDYSNVGKNVDISAPGDFIMSTVPDNDYASYNGTSMAAPVVSGVAALVWSVNPKFSGADVKKILLENTEHTAQPNEYYKFEEHLDLMDYPVVNARLAVEAALEQSFDMCRVELEVGANAQVELKNNETGEEFIFEADSQGKLSCLLEKGLYQITADGVVLSAAQPIEADSYILYGEAV